MAACHIQFQHASQFGRAAKQASIVDEQLMTEAAGSGNGVMGHMHDRVTIVYIRYSIWSLLTKFVASCRRAGCVSVTLITSWQNNIWAS